MIKSTLFLGGNFEGSTSKLNQKIQELPQGVHIALIDAVTEKAHTAPETFTTLQQVDTDGIYGALTAKPALIVVLDVQAHKELKLPTDSPVYATIKAESIEEALEILANQQFFVEFDTYVVSQ